MLKLDHITVIAPTLIEGVEHVRECLGIDVPFGARHEYMGTHNHRLQLGNSIYLEIVAIDPEGIKPGAPRWFGLDDQTRIRSDWEKGRRLQGWVANTDAIDSFGPVHWRLVGEKHCLPRDNPSFDFTIPPDGSLPMDGVVPSVINHRGDAGYISTIPDLGARLKSFILEHPNPDEIRAIYEELSIKGQPIITKGSEVRYRALIDTPNGLRELT